MGRRDGQPVSRDRFYSFCRFTARVLVRPFFRVRYFGTENISAAGKLIVCCNHKSVFDPILLALPFDRPIRYMAKSELFSDHGRLFRSLLLSLGAFPVRRNQGDLAAVKAAEQVLQRENILGIFPQGGVVANEVPFSPKAGAALLAGRSEAPILPAAVCCSGALRPFRKGAVRFGRVIRCEEFPRRRGSVDIRALGTLIADRVNELLEAGF